MGTVILARSAAPLNHDIIELWVILGTIAVVAMLAAALLAFALARWVSRPLAGLDSAARRLADGDLASRAVVDSGPPELRRLATTFNTMAGRLEALVHGNRAVIADVSHQLRTPLAALRLRLDLLAADTDPRPPGTSWPARSTSWPGCPGWWTACSRWRAPRTSCRCPPRWTWPRWPGSGSWRGTRWPTTGASRSRPGVGTGSARARASVLAWIGEGHLEQVLDNLIANALDALSAGGHVTVTAAVTTAGAQITVADDGPGMNAEDRERAFLRFSTSNPNGTGLGLAIVHRLVTSNGGTARLTETPGGGLTVILDFPGVPAPNGNVPASDSTSPQAALSL